MILFRNADNRYPFLREGPSQTPARWHGTNRGPAQYFADTSDGAWAEFLRHEEISDPADLAGVERALWAVEIPDDEPLEPPVLPHPTLTGDESSYPACQAEADRLRSAGSTGLRAPSAALLPGQANGIRVDGGEQPGPARDGDTIVLFGPRADVTGWQVVRDGRPPASLLGKVRSP